MRPLQLLPVVLIALLLPGIIHAQTLQNEPYGPYARNRMDVYLPQHCDSTTATVVLIHGGAWIIGNKKQWHPETVQALLQHGYAVASINYRYACGNYAVQVQDIEQALQYINKHSTTWHIGCNHFALVGVSAGGHLSLLYAHAFNSVKAVKAVVSLSGPTDLSDSLFHRYLKKYCIGFVLKRYTGVYYKKHADLYKQASPLYRYSDVPTLFIHGKNDQLVPTSQSVRMFEAMSTAGFRTDTVLLSDTDHLVTGKKDRNIPLIMDRILNWLKKYE